MLRGLNGRSRKGREEGEGDVEEEAVGLLDEEKGADEAETPPPTSSLRLRVKTANAGDNRDQSVMVRPNDTVLTLKAAISKAIGAEGKVRRFSFLSLIFRPPLVARPFLTRTAAHLPHTSDER